MSTSPSTTTNTSPTTSPLEGVPELTTSPLTDKIQRTDALHLIADSIAQQRQATNYALITHPITITVWLTTLAFLYQYLVVQRDEMGKMVTTSVGITMVILALVRLLGSGYLKAAEALNWSWIVGGADGTEGEGEPDILIGSIFGEEMIGALVLRMESIDMKKKGKAGQKKALIRAWTTKFRYRRKGIGSALLEEAIRIAMEKGGKDVVIEFARDHANSLMILPDYFGINRHFRIRQEKAEKMLRKVVETQNST